MKSREKRMSPTSRRANTRATGCVAMSAISEAVVALHEAREISQFQARFSELVGMQLDASVQFDMASQRTVTKSSCTPLAKDSSKPGYKAAPKREKCTAAGSNEVLQAAVGHARSAMHMTIERDRAFSPKEKEAARGLVLIADSAFRNLQSFARIRSRSESLVNLAIELGGALNVSDSISILTRRAAEMMGARAALLTLQAEERLEPMFATGTLEETPLANLAAAASALERLSRHVRSEVTVVNAEETSKHPAFAAMDWHSFVLCEFKANAGDRLGVLALAGCPLMRADDRQTLQAVVRQGTMALENARLFSRISRSSRQWAHIFDSLTDLVIVHDESDRVVRVNHAFAENLSRRPAEVVGMRLRELLSGGASAAQGECELCRSQNGSTERFQHVLGRTYLVSTSHVAAISGEGTQTIHVLKDVTERQEAERRYRELFDTIQEGAYFSSPEGHFIDVNDALVRLLGYDSQAEVLALDIPSQVYLRSSDRENRLRLLAEGPISGHEIALRRKDGSAVYVLENSSAVRAADGSITQYRGILLDVTATKRAQAQLHRERDFNRQILDNTQSLILVVDTAGLISYSNVRCTAVLPQPGIVGNRISELFHESDSDPWNSAFETALSGSAVTNIELRVRTEKEYGRFSVSIGPMIDDEQQVNSLVVVMTDITDVAIVRAKLMNAERLAAVGQLVSGVAHEVNNPLTAIIGFAELLLETPALPGTAHADVSVILQEAERTKSIVQNLLSFARQNPPKRELVDVNSILRKTLALRAYDFSNSGFELKQDFSELPGVVGDPHQIQQVFLNLLNNGFDAISETSRKGKMKVSTQCRGGIVQIDFRDDGPGIRQADRIFDPFFTTKEVGKGTGLGLSICYGIVTEHGGEILCSNNPEQPGATFTVRLPVAETQTLAAAGSAP